MNLRINGKLAITTNLIQSDADIVLAPSSYAGSVEIGRGDTDTDITYLRLKNASGTNTYLYPNSSGDAVSVSSSKP